ncbi:MAG: hypothetical protein RID53_19025 [Coleofasciculus sp. B1-GNL1-01]|uniref:hypothetical protein n=1 Tax=Coleofasciculus sp. B1-GNL1-01 TaxID=3068484 RepID=UPI0032F1B22E
MIYSLQMFTKKVPSDYEGDGGDGGDGEDGEVNSKRFLFPVPCSLFPVPDEQTGKIVNILAGQ